MIKKRILISQLYYTNTMHEFLLENHELVEELFIDSGGFSWFNKGFKETEDFYYSKYMKKVDKIRELSKYFKIRFIQLDKPTQEEDTKRLWRLQKNLTDFYPVFTAGSDLDYLEELAKENELIFLGAVAHKSNEWVYNYLEPSFSFERRFSDILNKYNTKIHLLGKSTFKYNLDYIYTMDSCMYNGSTMRLKYNSLRNYFLDSVFNKYAKNNLISYSLIYLERSPTINPLNFVYAVISFMQLKMSLQKFTEEEQQVFDLIKNHYINNTIPYKKRDKQEKDMQLEIFEL